MKSILVLVLFLIAGNFVSQIYICRDGVTKFTSEAPLELIKAKSSRTAGIIDVPNKNVAFSIDIDSFEGFNSGLQREHFLDNYMETDKYRNATFKGKIIEDINFTKEGVVSVRAKGVFNIHGTEKEKLIKVKITIKNKQIDIETSFEIPLEDHNIKIPKVVNQKIASVIMVDVKAELKPKS